MINNIPVFQIVFLVLVCLYWVTCSFVVVHRLIRLKVFRELSIADCTLIVAFAPATLVVEFLLETYIELNIQFENKPNNSKSKFEVEK